MTPVPLPLVLPCSADRTFLRKWKWSQMVMDEAHALKNANSQRSRRLRKLAAGERNCRAFQLCSIVVKSQKRRW